MSFSLYCDDGNENTDDHRISEESERKQCEPLNNKSKKIDDTNQNVSSNESFHIHCILSIQFKRLIWIFSVSFVK